MATGSRPPPFATNRAQQSTHIQQEYDPVYLQNMQQQQQQLYILQQQQHHHPHPQYVPPFQLPLQKDDDKLFRYGTILTIIVLILVSIFLANELFELKHEFHSSRHESLQDSPPHHVQQEQRSIIRKNEDILFLENQQTRNSTFSEYKWDFVMNPDIGKWKRYPSVGSVPHLNTYNIVKYSICCRTGPTVACASDIDSKGLKTKLVKHEDTGEDLLLVVTNDYNLASKPCVLSFTLVTVDSDDV